jgi:tetratricopeptide (TPR) repeat protein
MRATFVRGAVVATAVLLAAAAAAAGRDITLPPSGDNQFASVTQGIGLVRVTVQYNSPDVHAPDGTDRTGHIWGELVPYGLHDLGYNDCKQCPWRAGANENTVFTVSHPVTIEGQPLPAGSYGLHMIAGADEWTVIFSRNHTAWGSYWYDPAEDQLRVRVKPLPAEYNEWLTYEFTDRRPDRATLALKWENLQVPFRIGVADAPGLYVAKLREEFKNAAAFEWDTWRRAAEYCLQHKAYLDQGLAWAQEAVSRPGNGVENFQTLSMLAQLQIANGQPDEGARTLDRALAWRGTSPTDVHQLARSFQAQGRDDEAKRLFFANARRFPNQWPVQVGLARAYALSGDMAKAAAHARLALKQAPDELNRRNLEGLVRQFEAAAKKP